MIKRILFIGIDQKNSKNLMDRLNANNYLTDFVFKGLEGFTWAQSTLPDIIVLNMDLSDIDGHIICRLLKSNKLTNVIPIILCATRVRYNNSELVRQSGASAFIIKDFDTIIEFIYIFLQDELCNNDKRSISKKYDSNQHDKKYEYSYIL